MCVLQLDPPPDYLQTRIDIFDRLKRDYDSLIAGKYVIAILLTSK